MNRMFSWICACGLTVGIASWAWSATIFGGTAGNGNDSQENTFHFQSQNIDVRLTKPDGLPLSQAEVPSAYGQAYKIFYINEDWLAKLGLQAVGADLSGANWTSASFPSQGQVAVDPASGRFKFAAGNWAAPCRLNPAAIDSNPVYVAINNQGQALFARVEKGTAWHTQAFVNAYDPLLGWQGALPVDAGGSSLTTAAVVALNDSGLGLCLFGESGGQRVFLNTYQSGTGWQGAVQVDQDVESAVSPQGVILNNAGAGALFFRGSTNLYARTLAPASGWDAAKNLDTYNQSIDYMDAAINSAGQMACVFVQSNGVYVHIFATQYDPLGNTWSTPTPVDTGGGSSDSSFPAVDINASGMIACTFKKSDGNTLRQYANLYIPGSGWQGPAVVDAIANTTLSTLAPLYSDIILEDSGHAVCVFSQVDSPTGRVLYVRDYLAGSGWQTPQSLASVSDTNTALFLPKLVKSGQGQIGCGYSMMNLITSFYQPVYIGYTPSSGWGAPVTFGPATSAITSLAMNSQGWVAAGFQELSTGTARSYGAVHRVESPPGQVSVNYFYQSLTLTPSSTSTPVREKQVAITGREIKPLQNHQAHIAVALDQDGWVAIHIYSLRGQRVRTLTNQFYATGRYQLAWGGEDDAGGLVASGIYIIQVKAPGLEQKQKVAVVK